MLLGTAELPAEVGAAASFNLSVDTAVPCETASSPLLERPFRAFLGGEREEEEGSVPFIASGLAAAFRERGSLPLPTEATSFLV